MSTWKETVRLADVFHDDALPLREKGETIVTRLRALRAEGVDLDFDNTLEELTDAAEADDVGWFDQVWHAVYDWADAERVWIETVL